MNAAEYTKMYDLEDRYWWFVGRRRVALSLLAKYISKGRVLDIGCGTGVISRELQAFGPVVSLDMSELALGYCRERGLTALVQADGTALPLANGSFDAVIGLDIFEHIEDDQAAFREAFRVLSPGGVLVLSVPAFRSLWGPHDVALHHFRRYRQGEIAERLRAAGFEVRRCTYSVFFLFPFVVLSRLVDKFRRGPARASLPRVSPGINAFLVWLQDLEGRLILRQNLPWGSSVIAVAQKPTTGSGNASSI